MAKARPQPRNRTVWPVARPWRQVAAVAATALLVACRPVGGGGGAGTAAPSDVEPAIRAGASTAAGDSAAAAIIRRADASLEQGDPSGAIVDARLVVEQYPTARRSSLALPILARAALATEAWDAARRAADQYAALFPPSDGRHAVGVVLSAEAMRGSGQAEAAVQRLLTLPVAVEATGPPDAAAMDLMRTLATQLDNVTLERVVAGTPPRALAAPLMVEQALALHFRGDEEGARALAQEVSGRVARGPEYDIARSILAGDVESVGGAAHVLGSLLAETGSPGLVDFSRFVREGIEVAIDVNGDAGRRPVALRSVDDRGSPAEASLAVQRLETEGALAVVGPLLPTTVQAAADGRGRRTVLISPTARSLPAGAEGVYSLAGPDPGAARALAGYVRDAGLGRVVVLRPNTHESLEEAQAFREALDSMGIPLVREMSYDSGATFFEDQLQEVAGLLPNALVLPLPARDVELLAPQITFFGLDTLGIQVLGTAAWATESIVQAVDPRHTTGVVAAATMVPGAPSEGHDRFVQAYESLFRKTLRSPVPALGYDAASLILEAYRTSGARTTEDVIRGLEQIRDYPGATGRLSVVDGRIVREHTLVRFQEGTWVPLRFEEDR